MSIAYKTHFQSPMVRVTNPDVKHDSFRHKTSSARQVTRYKKLTAHSLSVKLIHGTMQGYGEVKKTFRYPA